MVLILQVSLGLEPKSCLFFASTLHGEKSCFNLSYDTMLNCKTFNLFLQDFIIDERGRVVALLKFFCTRTDLNRHFRNHPLEPPEGRLRRSPQTAGTKKKKERVPGRN